MVASTYNLEGYVYRSSFSCWTIDLKCALLFFLWLYSALVDLLDVNGPEPG